MLATSFLIQLEGLAWPIALAAVGCAALGALMWLYPPWWRKKPTPRRQIQIDRDLIRIQRLRRRHPDLWPDPNPPLNMKSEVPNGTEND